jgi:hypothetical protein
LLSLVRPMPPKPPHSCTRKRKLKGAVWGTEWRSPSICESQAMEAKERDGEKAFQTPQNCRFEPVPQRVLMPLPCSTGRISLGTFSSQTARASVDDLRPNPVTPLATYCVCPLDRVTSTSSRHCRVSIILAHPYGRQYYHRQLC